MAELNSVPNPYDFAKPVSDQEPFIGRDEELTEISYYLGHASKARHPINIAILGGRASGKTSLLNMAENEANKLGLLTVRIDLDEDDAANQLSFFFKVFDAIFSAACDLGAYGGKQSKTFETYLDMVCSLVVPEDKTFCPFLFPVQYSKAQASSNFQAHVPDNRFRQDLIALRAELSRPIVLLFAQGTVHTTSRTPLQ